MIATTYLVYGGDENFHYLHGRVQIEEETFQVFSDPEKAEVYRQDLLNGTNNSGLRGGDADERWKYDRAEIRTFNPST